MWLDHVESRQLSTLRSAAGSLATKAATVRFREDLQNET
jgi:hypothetical protein